MNKFQKNFLNNVGNYFVKLTSINKNTNYSVSMDHSRLKKYFEEIEDQKYVVTVSVPGKLVMRNGKGAEIILIKLIGEPMEAPVKKKEFKISEVPSHLKGDQQLSDESREDFLIRRKHEKKLMRMRLKFGVRQFKHTPKAGESSTKRPFVNGEKAIQKSMREQKRAIRKAKAKERKLAQE